MFATSQSSTGLHPAVYDDKTTHPKACFPLHDAQQSSNKTTDNKMPPSQ